LEQGPNVERKELAREEAKVRRFVRIASAVAGGACIGFYIAVRTYDGPSFATAFAVCGVSGGVVSALALVYGPRFWDALYFSIVRRR
jgi:hypothetical protein